MGVSGAGALVWAAEWKLGWSPARVDAAHSRRDLTFYFSSSSAQMLIHSHTTPHVLRIH